MLKLKTALSSVLCAVIILCLQSCGGGKSGILEHIPVDSYSVMSINVKDIILQSGGNLEGSGALTPNDALYELLDETSQNADFLRLICTLAPYIEIENVFRYEYTEGSGFTYIMKVTDKEGFVTLMDRNESKKREISGYKEYNLDFVNLLLKDNFLWATSDTDGLIAINKKIGSDHFAGFEPLRTFFETEDHDIEFVIQRNIVHDTDYKYLLGLASFKTSGIFAEFSLMNDQGQMYQFRNSVHEVDRELLQYIPSQTQILFALGKVDDWDSFFKSVDNLLPETLAPYMFYYGLTKEYITKIDGTTLIALAPVAGSQSLKKMNLQTWQVLAMTHLPQNESDEILSMVNSFLELQGIAYKETEQGIFTANLMGVHMMYGRKDGYLFFSNYDILDGGNTSMATAYESKRIVAELLIPHNSETMKALNLPWGVDLNLAVNTTNSMIVLKLPGANGPLLKDIVNELATLRISDLELSLNDR